jgi:stage II sporulation protein M
MPKKSKNKKRLANHLKKSKNAITYIVIIFLFSLILGFLNANILADKITPIIESLISKTENLTAIELTAFILINNTITSLASIILGIFLGIFPIITTITNGVVLGFVMERTAQISILEWWRLLPHGIFELPAIFISLGLGLKLGMDTLKNFLEHNKKSTIIKILGVISLIFGLIGVLIIKLSFSLIFNPLPESSSIPIQETIPLKYTLSLISFIFGLLFLAPFLLLFFISNKELRNSNLKRINESMLIFIKIVIPLLIIAAIIEGALITILP